jgi:hypothetical protein
VKAFCRQPTLKRRADDLARRVAQRANCENGGEKLFRVGRANDSLESRNPFGWRRNYCRVAANEKPDATVAAELSMRRNDDTGIAKRRRGHTEKPRPMRVDALCCARWKD